MDAIGIGIGIGCLLALGLCTVGIYAHLLSSARERERNIKDRVNHATEHLRLCQSQIEAMTEIFREEKENKKFREGMVWVDQFDFHASDAIDLTKSARDWLRL